MKVTPAFYAHLISLLSSLARGQIAVALEGGYFIPTLAEAASLTLGALLGDPCPPLDPITGIHPTVIDTICNVRRMLLEKWKCFNVSEYHFPIYYAKNTKDDHNFHLSYFGEKQRTSVVDTDPPYPKNTPEDIAYFTKLNEALQVRYAPYVPRPVCYVYDDQMLEHKPPPGSVSRPERPERLTAIRDVLREYGLERRYHRVDIVRRDFGSFSPHSRCYFDGINQTLEQTNDIYSNENTHNACQLAACGLLTIADKIMNKEFNAGAAIVRPPGHHAERNKPMGFCLINNVAICANYLLQRYKLQRILIVDFDIHHGNGTQTMFYDSNQVMYVSIHKDENGKFFPAGSFRNYTDDGFGCGVGYNINIPFNRVSNF